MYEAGMKCRERKSKFIKEGILHWSNIGCIYDCFDCPYTYKRSYMYRGFEVYNNIDDMEAELDDYPDSMSPLPVGNPLGSKSFLKLIDLLRSKFDALRMHTRYIDDYMEEFIMSQDKIKYMYNSTLNKDIVINNLEKLIDTGAEVTLGLRPIAGIDPNMNISQEDELSNIEAISTEARSMGVQNITVHGFHIMEDDIDCIDSHLASRMVSLGDAGKMTVAGYDDYLIDVVHAEISAIRRERENDIQQ